ncbi:hypothetical protein ACFY1L_55780 [Streptomyces sp. NPDC001663]
MRSARQDSSTRSGDPTGATDGFGGWDDVQASRVEVNVPTCGYP